MWIPKSNAGSCGSEGIDGNGGGNAGIGIEGTPNDGRGMFMPMSKAGNCGSAGIEGNGGGNAGTGIEIDGRLNWKLHLLIHPSL